MESPGTIGGHGFRPSGGWFRLAGKALLLGLAGLSCSAAVVDDRPEVPIRLEMERLVSLMETDPVEAMTLGLSLLESPSAGDPAIEAALRLQIAALAREQGDLSRARLEASRARELAESIDDSQLTASALNEMVGVLLGEGQVEGALRLAEDSLSIRRSLGDQSEIAKTLNNIGLIHSQTGQYAQALAYYLESLRLKEEIGDDQSAAGTLNNLAIVRFEMGDYGKSVADLERARAIYEKSGELPGLADVLDNLGRAKREQGELDEALRLHLASLELERQMARPEGIAVSLAHAGLVYNRLGRHEEALRFSEEALAINRSLGLPRGLAFSLLHLGIAQFRLGNLEAASDALNEGIDQALRAGDRGLLRELHGNLSEVQANQGLFAEAYASLQESRRIEQLIASREIGNRMAELEASYKFDRKEQEIEMLQLERELQQLTIERSEQQIALLAQENRMNQLGRNSLIGAFVAVCIVLMVLQSQYRLKRGTEQALREKNAEIVRQKEMVEAQGRKIGEANRELHLTNMKLRELSRAVEQSPTGVLITDRDGAITYVNPRFTEVSGFTLDDIRGANPRIFQSGHHGRDFYKRLWSTILTGRVWRGCFVNCRKDGSLYQEEATISPVINEVGEIVNFVAVMEYHPLGDGDGDGDGGKPSVIDDRANSESETRPVRSVAGPLGRRVVGVVDLPVNRKVLEHLLNALNCTVSFVRDEDELEKAMAGKSFDLLVLDPDAKRRNISDWIGTVRGFDQGTSLPIICIVDDDHESGERPAEAGADGVLVRPVSLSALREELDRCGKIGRS
ncbi:MAG: tetratricopeptide repeat protein [Opitutaceae bacterium]